VDDFMAAVKDRIKLRSLFTFLATKINIESEVGMVSHYKVIEIVQY
jgi:hypothetical protein